MIYFDYCLDILHKLADFHTCPIGYHCKLRLMFAIAAFGSEADKVAATDYDDRLTGGDQQIC